MNENNDRQMDEILALFYFAYRTFTEKPDQMIEKYNIQRTHHRILFFIAHVPGINVHQLLEILEVSKQALHAPLRQLTEKGFIFSRPADFDKRYKQLFLTEKGQKLEEELSNVQREQMRLIFSDLGGNHQLAWTNVMKKLSSVRPGQKYLKTIYSPGQERDRQKSRQ